MLNKYSELGKKVFIEGNVDTDSEFNVFYDGEEGVYTYTIKIYELLYNKFSLVDAASPEFDMCMRTSRAMSSFVLKMDSITAITRLQKQGLLEPIACEDNNLVSNADLFMLSYSKGVGSQSDFRQIVCADREDAVLHNINERANSPLPILVFGAAHWFYDNIRRWNKANPNDKFSLIVIEPKHLLGS